MGKFAGGCLEKIVFPEEKESDTSLASLAMPFSTFECSCDT